jgi:ADP-heptose:LPS heptosyltransferase
VCEWRHPVAFFMNGIGDHILSLPALRAVAEYCRGRLTLVCSAHPASQVFDELPVRRLVRVAQETFPRQTVFDWRAAAAQITECDLFLSLVPCPSEGLAHLVEALRPEFCVGVVPRGNSTAVNCQQTWDRTKHSSRAAFEVVRCLWPGAAFEQFVGPPVFTEDTRGRVQAIKALLPAGTKCLALHTETLPEKMWPVERFNRVIEEFLRRHDDYACFLVATRDTGIDAGAFGDRLIPTFSRTSPFAGREYGCLPLRVAQCLVAGSQLFLGVDSCFLHVADFCSVPAVALFGPTSPREFGCVVAPNRTLDGHGSMEAIEVDDVLESLDQMANAHSGGGDRRL